MNENCWYKDVCEQECSNSCIRYLEMSYLMSNSGIPYALQIPPKLEATTDYDKYVRLQEIKDNILDFVNNGRNLLICSKFTGNGKTTWAVKLLLKYFDEIWAGNGFRVRGLFVHVPTLLTKLKNFNDPSLNDFKDRLLNVDLVVWDDIASTGLSQYDYSQLLVFIDQRLLSKKANIYTSNASSQESWEKAMGVKITSRILNSSEIVEFHGKDKRETW